MDPELHAFLMLYPLNVLNLVQEFKTTNGLHPSSEISLVSFDYFYYTTPAQEANGDDEKDDHEFSYKDFQHLSGSAKITALKEHGLCIRCGQEMHPEGETCPHNTTTCQNCGKKGHISPVCGKPRNQTGQ